MNTKSIDKLSIILEQIDYQFTFMMGAVYRKVPEDRANSRRCLQVLRSRENIQQYVSRYELDIIILTYPDHMPVVLTRTELGWVKRTEKLTDWINEHWKSELLIIAVS